MKRSTTTKPMTKSGFCAFPSPSMGHPQCTIASCTCECHTDDRVFSGQGILYVVIDDHDVEREPGSSTMSIMADAIEEALDNGFETSDQIARYLCTSSFRHIPDRRVKYNSALKAADLAGADLVPKLVSGYLGLVALANDEEDEDEKEFILTEARGWASAISVVLRPFDVEDPKDRQCLDWDKVDNLTDEFIEQHQKSV